MKLIPVILSSALAANAAIAQPTVPEYKVVTITFEPTAGNLWEGRYIIENQPVTGPHNFQEMQLVVPLYPSLMTGQGVLTVLPLPPPQQSK